MAAWPDLQRTLGLLWRTALDAAVIAAVRMRRFAPRYGDARARGHAADEVWPNVEVCVAHPRSRT